jgi:hypothetical protein
MLMMSIFLSRLPDATVLNILAAVVIDRGSAMDSVHAILSVMMKPALRKHFVICRLSPYYMQPLSFHQVYPHLDGRYYFTLDDRNEFFSEFSFCKAF